MAAPESWRATASCTVSDCLTINGSPGRKISPEAAMPLASLVSSRCVLVGQLPVLDPVRLVRAHALALLQVGRVILVVPFVPDHLGIALKGKDVRGDAVEE